MTNPQGTAWETEIVRSALDMGLPAMRLVKQGQKDEADVLMGPSGSTREDKLGWNIPALFWKRIVKRGGKNRGPLGERYVVVLTLDDFLDMMATLYGSDLCPAVWVQAKWAEKISVTKVLGGLRAWLNARLAG